ncbi:MAG: hypothetical protein K2X29_14345 [Candidatus Obscuribacterales bacterium]|nr:hypothetical protein [Candidatus Obscuribacterales bacterium]
MNGSSDASIFSSMYDFYKKGSDTDMTDPWASPKKPDSGGGGGGGGGKSASGRGGSSIRGGRAGVKSYHQGQHFSSSKINAIVKVSYARSNRDSARHIIQHADYLQQRERGPFEKEREFFNRERDQVDRDEVITEIIQNRGRDAAMFKIILSPNNNDLDRKEMTREIMERFELENDTKLHWAAIEHENTHHYHVHILVAGRDEEGHSLRISPIQIEQLRAIAKEYQFELQHEYLNDRELMNRELEYFREHIEILSEAKLDREMQQQLEIYNPQIDQLVRDQFHLMDHKFDKELQHEFGFDKYYDLSKEFADVNKELERADIEIIRELQNTNPELFPYLSREREDRQETVAELGQSLYQVESVQKDREDVREPQQEHEFIIGPIVEGPEQEKEFERLTDELTQFYADAYPPNIERDIEIQAQFEYDLNLLYDHTALDPVPTQDFEREPDAFEVFWDSQNFEGDLDQDLSELDPWPDEQTYEDTTQAEPTSDTEVQLEDDIERDDDDPY